MMSKRFDVITVLDTCVDLMMQGDVVPRFGQAEQVVDSYFLEMGGSACIFACQCAKLGLKTAGVGAVGADAFGDLALERLGQAGVDVSAVSRGGGIQTGLGLALCKPGGDRAILTVLGTIDWADPTVMEALLPQARHLHIASYYLMTRMRPHWPQLLRQAKALGLTTSLDTNWDPAERWDGVDDLYPHLDILFPNEAELQAFTGVAELEEAARVLAQKVPLVAVKLGAKGAMAFRYNGESAFCPASTLDTVDTVGAGDTFDGGFLYGFLNGRSLDECLQAGVFCAGRSVTKPGGFLGQPKLSGLNENKKG